MALDLATATRTANFARYLPGQRGGLYESFFLRANHPTRPLAFWIRYALTTFEGAPERARAELWAIVFNGETGAHVAVKREVPMTEARFARDRFHVAFGGAELDAQHLTGESSSRDHRIAWDLRYEGKEEPLFFQRLPLYTLPFPRAKTLVGVPAATFHGTITVDGKPIAIDAWPGSQNHNWGSRHTDRYAWGQVAGFDDHPESVLEVATARLKIGPVLTPPLTPLVLRHRGEEHAFNSVVQAVRARGRYDHFTWRFSSSRRRVAIEGEIAAKKQDFVALLYDNPSGGVKHCLNSKIARCSLTLRRDGKEERLTSGRAAFEILTDDAGHGVPVLA